MIRKLRPPLRLLPPLPQRPNLPRQKKMKRHIFATLPSIILSYPCLFGRTYERGPRISGAILDFSQSSGITLGRFQRISLCYEYVQFFSLFIFFFRSVPLFLCIVWTVRHISPFLFGSFVCAFALPPKRRHALFQKRFRNVGLENRVHAPLWNAICVPPPVLLLFCDVSLSPLLKTHRILLPASNMITIFLLTAEYLDPSHGLHAWTTRRRGGVPDVYKGIRHSVIKDYKTATRSIHCLFPAIYSKDHEGGDMAPPMFYASKVCYYLSILPSLPHFISHPKKIIGRLRPE